MDRFAVRRRLLQGSLSAPLVLTVASASAQSRTTFLACIGKDQVGGPAYLETDDGLYRQPVPTYKFVQSGQPDIPGPFVKEGTTYYLLSDLTPFSPTAGYTEQVTGNSAGQLVYFNDNGSPVGYGFDNSSNGTAVTRSCHTSFVVGP